MKRSMHVMGALATIAILASGTAGRVAAQEAGTGQDSVPARLSLGDAARLAARRSTSSRIAASQAEESDAQARQSWAGVLPKLSADAVESQNTINLAAFGFDASALPGGGSFFNPDKPVGPIRTTDFRARLTMPLVDVSAYDRMKSAHRQADAAHTGADASAQDAAVQAARAYLQVLQAREQLAARQRDLSLAQELLQMAQDQLSAGTGIQLDVTRARARVATVRSQILDASTAVDRSRLAFLRTVGLPLATDVELADSLGSLPFPETLPSPDDAESRALESRPAVRAAEMRLQALDHSTAAARAERYPTLSLVADDGLYGTDLDHLLNTYTWRVQVSVPLFTGLSHQGRVDAEQARQRTEAYRLEDLRRNVSYQAREAVLTARAAREQTAAARERLRLAQQEVDQAEQRVRAGVSGNEEVVRASLGLSDARSAYIQAMAGAQAARVNLAWVQGAVTEIP